MKVKFTSENGLCPYFEYGNFKFYIQDRRVGSIFKYSCYVQKKESELLTFDDEEQALTYVQQTKRARFEFRSSDKSLYISPTSIFVVC